MRLLYGVQATGNGHISRARALVGQLQAAGWHIDFVFSGRPAAQLFDMHVFGAFRCFGGLSFASHAGNIQRWQTWQQLKLKKVYQDIQALDTRSYDLVLTDFEPITAWAARRQGTPCIGIGHQYAFLYDIPKRHDSYFHRWLFRWFAPTAQHIPLHWHHFNQPIFPPLLHLPTVESDIDERQVLVYLPFESAEAIASHLHDLPDWTFSIFHPNAQRILQQGMNTNQRWFLPDLQHFQHCFSRAAKVICNAGFELVSEALQCQKAILVKPLHGQMEQASNAHALELLGYANVCQQLNTEFIHQWLAQADTLNKVRFNALAPEIPVILSNMLNKQTKGPIFNNFDLYTTYNQSIQNYIW